MAEAESSQPLRNSTGKLKVKDKGVDIGPNYLRASTGSCHDACKYGTPHVFKAVPKRPVRRRLRPKDEIPVEILVDKRTARAVKSSSDASAASISTKPEVTDSGQSVSASAPKSGRQQASLSVKVLSSSLDMESSQPRSSISVKKGSSSVVKSRPAFGSSSVRRSDSALRSTIRDVQPRRLSSSADLSESFRNRTSKLARTPPTSGSVSKTTVIGRKPFSSDASKSFDREATSSYDGKAPLKYPSTKIGGSLNSKSTRVSTGKSSPPKLPRRTSCDGLNRKRSTGSKMDNEGSPTGSSSLKTRKNPKSAVKNNPTSSARKKPNLPGAKVASLNMTKKFARTEGSGKAKDSCEYLNVSMDSINPENDKVSEKTLHVIEVESSNQRSPGSDHRGSSDNIHAHSSRSLDAVETNSASEYTEGIADDSDSYSDDNPLVMSEGEGKIRNTPRKSRALNHEGNGSPLVRLKFRRGKVLDPQSEARSPRRLRFRRRSISGNDLRGGSNERRRSFKGRNAGVNIDETKHAGVKVVLRHQDVQEKKSERGLLNNMIEETANKLVGIRRSKVLALVDAFETVISLQEGKSSVGKSSPFTSPER